MEETKKAIDQLEESRLKILNKIAERILLKDRILYSGKLEFREMKDLADMINEDTHRDIEDLQLDVIG